MPDTFAITIVSIAIFTVIAAFLKGKSQDKCLRDFSRNAVTLEETTGKTIWGKLRVETTGLELIYPAKYKDKSGHDEMSYIMYKHEYPNIQALTRYHDQLDERDEREREKELRRTYHPNVLRRFKRKVRNFFNIIRDSIMDVVNLLIGQAKKSAPGGAILTSQDKYISKTKQELVKSAETSFEPLLERHIGKRVVLELVRAGEIFEYPGVLKDYTAEFIEVMDIDYKIKEDQPARKADLVVLRKYGVIRHLGE